MADVHVAILAAGKGTRMKSSVPKVLHRVGGLPMIEHVLAAAAILNPRSTTVIIGHAASALKSALLGKTGLQFVVQEPQLGTAHALLTAESALGRAAGVLVLLSGDVPLLAANSLKRLVDQHLATGAAATVLTARVDHPFGYGRIVRNGRQIARIVEEKDATAAERAIHEINSGIYAFALDGLFDALHRIASENAQGEYYLPDLVAIYRNAGRAVETLTVDNVNEIKGINSRSELAEVSRIMRQETNAALMDAGVTLHDPATAYIDRAVRIGTDTIIHPGVTIEGATTIGRACQIHSGVRIVNSTIGDDVVVLDHSVIVESTVAAGAAIGPFAHLRTHVDLKEKASIGNFVELKNTVVGAGSKARHLAYLGDAVIGAAVNIGAGTITCNYDGQRKQTTTIEDGAFVGSDSQLVAPVTVGRGAYVGSGTTVRASVPPGALAVSAGKQQNIEGWVERRKKAPGKVKSEK
jgi:bifunctional UDP-N-acetylglucosamine pyrophosphorylase/glucosamine-1-phosphate N-acetyltransferase